MTAAPGQTVGPFFHLGLPYAAGNELVPPATPGAIRFHGRVLDGAGEPVPDALIELWQPAPDGQIVRTPGSLSRDGWTFTGFGRAATDPDGHYWFSTLEPGPLPSPTAASASSSPTGLAAAGPPPAGASPAGASYAGLSPAGLSLPGASRAGRPPFFAVTVFARGLLDRLFTRAYLPEAELFETDPLLAALPEDRRVTLITTREERGLRFDIRLQGEGETVFLRYPGTAE